MTTATVSFLFPSRPLPIMRWSWRRSRRRWASTRAPGRTSTPTSRPRSCFWSSTTSSRWSRPPPISRGCWRGAARTPVPRVARPCASPRRVYAITPLGLPDARAPGDAAEIIRSPAVALFVDRPRAVDPSFEMRPRTPPRSPPSAPGSTACRWRSSWPRRAARRWHRTRSCPPKRTTEAAQGR